MHLVGVDEFQDRRVQGYGGVWGPNVPYDGRNWPVVNVGCLAGVAVVDLDGKELCEPVWFVNGVWLLHLSLWVEWLPYAQGMVWLLTSLLL